MADTPEYQKQIMDFMVGMQVHDHKPATQVVMMAPRRSGKTWASQFLMARSARVQRQKAMQNQIEKTKQGGTIHVQAETDAEFWSDMAQEEYGRGDLIFRAGSGKMWKAGKPYDPNAKTTTLFKPATFDADVNKFDPNINAVDAAIEKAARDSADRKARDQEEKLRDLLYGRTEATSATLAPGIPMMKPISAAPKDGREVMLYCPNESPSHVAAKYVKAYDKDGGGWEGWMYADPILADIAPEGPEGATHYYELPTPDTKLAEFASGGTISAETFKDMERKFARLNGDEFAVPNDRKIDHVFRDEMRQATRDATGMPGHYCGIPIENFEDDRFTVDQLVELKRRGADPSRIPACVRTVISMKIDPIGPLRADANTPVTPIPTNHEVICPVVEIDRKRGQCTVILPEGRCERLDHIPNLMTP